MLKYMIVGGCAVETEKPASIFLQDSDFNLALKNPSLLHEIELRVGEHTVIGRLGKMKSDGVFEEQTYHPSDVDSIISEKGELCFYERV